MDINGFSRISDTHWQIDPRGRMRVPAIIHASETLLRDMDDKVREQLVNVTIPEPYREVGQPVLIGGSMGTGSWVLAGMAGSETAAFSSAYKDVAEVVRASEQAGLARRVARLQPLICIKG